jgi:glycosyltransferase involved in cell wall biosynthesis
MPDPASFRRIAFVSTMNGVPWGGSEDLWSETALALRRRGHAVAASVLRWPVRPQPLQELARHGVAIAFRPRRRPLSGRIAQKIFNLFSPGPIALLQRQWLKRSRADLVVISQGGPWDGVPWMLACCRMGIPYCAIVHANSEQWWPLDEHLDGIRAALAGARRVYFVSHANRQLMELQCGARLAHAEVIANPCRVDRAATVPWPAGDNPLRLACVGRMSPNAKGQDVLLQVLARPKWKGRAIQLHLYGTGPSERSIQTLASFLGLTAVFFHGQVADIRELWAANHALVLPSRFEGLPLVIVEAMLCARPVITTSVAGNAQFVTDNISGFVAEAPTVALLDDAMERAWSRRAEWSAIGARARADVLRAIPEDPIGEFTEKLLQVALSRGAPGKERAPRSMPPAPRPAIANARTP